MSKKYPNYIVIEGPIGVGKTALAKLLANTFNTDLMLEQAGKNPFLPRFYANPRSFALSTQLYFLFQRAHQIADLRQTDLFKSLSSVSDFLLEKDRLFANINLDKDELVIYQQVYQRLAIDAPPPDLVIYLQALPDILMQRIIERGHDYEKEMDKAYIQKVNNAYIDFFHHYDEAPLLIVNTENFDFVNNEQDYNLLLAHIRDLSSGKRYLNPREL